MNRDLEAALTFAAVAAAAAAAAATLIVPRTAAAATGDITVDPTPFVSTTTRGDVRAELLQGSQFARDTEWVQQANAAVPFKSSITRAQARDQYKAARSEVQALTSEDSGSMTLKIRPRNNPTTVMGAPAQ
jgi:hypothetical protein